MKTDGSWGSDYGRSGGFEYDNGYSHGYDDSGFDSGNSYEGNGFGGYNGWEDK